jgi:sigma-B regulation protein RsbU (phosphoserine phosphatase)
MKRLFLGIFSVFCVIILVIGAVNNYQINQITKYQYNLQQVDELTQDLMSHTEEVNYWILHPEIWDKLSDQEAAYQSRSEAFWQNHYRRSLFILGTHTVKEVLNNPEFDVEFTLTYRHTEQIESNILTQLAQIGFKESGAIGRMRTIAHAVEAETPAIRNKILSIRRHEKDFFMRHDEQYADKLNAEIDSWKKTDEFPKSMFDYQKHFGILHAAVDKVFISYGHSSYERWSTETALQLANLRSLRKGLLSHNLSKSREIQEFNSLMNILILILGVGLSVLFSARLSKSVVSLQKTMESYISSNYETVLTPSRFIPKNEFGKLILHFVQLTRKINQDVKLLEARVERRTLSLQEKNEELEMQHQEILRSMRYAKDLQRSLMAHPKELKYLFNTYELFYQSKELVGGDFYWSRQVLEDGRDLRYFALADCTGHGVPGALLGVMGMQALDEILGLRTYEPNEILNSLRWYISQRLNRNNNRRHDGMDIALICIDQQQRKLQFAGAHQSAWILRNNAVHELKGQRMPVGWSESHNANFITQEWELEPGDRILLFSDGICDQFGGDEDKKWGKKNLRELLQANQHVSAPEQFELIIKQFNAWKGDGQQTDDCTLVLLEPGMAKGEPWIRTRTGTQELAVVE